MKELSFDAEVFVKRRFFFLLDLLYNDYDNEIRIWIGMLALSDNREKARKMRLTHAKRTLSLLIVMSILILLCFSGCKKVNNEYPDIPSSETSETSQTTGNEFIPETSILELTIASPLSYETCQYIAKLYYLKSLGLLGDGVTGETVDLDYLASIDLPFILHVYSTSENGCSLSTLNQWKNQDSMPDIFLTDCFDQAVDQNLVAPITDYMAQDPLLAADRVYPDMITSFYINGNQYGVPYQTSAAVLFCDMEVFRNAGVPSVSFRQTRSSLLKLLSELDKMNTENDDGKAVLPFYLAGDMIPFLPSSMYNHQYLSASDAEDRNDQAYRDSYSYVESIIQSGYSFESLSEEDIFSLFSGISPLLSRRVGVWAGTTDEIMIYDNYMPNTLCMMQMPGIREDEYSAPLLISYPLCVSTDCQFPKEACELACFFALDEDALLLASRLEPREGYLPSVTSPSVWKTVVRNQKYGNYMEQYQALMDQSIMIPAVSQSDTYRKDLEYISGQVERIKTAKQEQNG